MSSATPVMELKLVHYNENTFTFLGQRYFGWIVCSSRVGSVVRS